MRFYIFIYRYDAISLSLSIRLIKCNLTLLYSFLPIRLAVTKFHLIKTKGVQHLRLQPKANRQNQKGRYQISFDVANKIGKDKVNRKDLLGTKLEFTIRLPIALTIS